MIALFAAGSMIALPPAIGQNKRIYVAPDDHTDYLWSASEAQYRDYFPRALDAYLDEIDAHQNNPADFQAKWNTDGTIWLRTFEQSRTPAQFDRLMARVKDGHIGVVMNTLVSVHGATPLEGILRDYYYAGRLERRYNFRFDLAMAQENQTLPYGLGSVMAGAGARYFWKGVCGGPQGAYCTNVAAPGDRALDAYWWTGADGSRVLAKWMSLQPAVAPAGDPNQGPGGYAEARYPATGIPSLDSNADFQRRWPYAAIGLFGAGWDDPEYIVRGGDARDFPALAAQLTTAGRRVIVSNEVDFFRDFEQNYGATLPSQAVSFGNEWETCNAAFAAKSARVKNAIEGLRSAEALATIVSLSQPGFMTGRTAARDEAFHSIGLFFEHNLCATGGQASPDERAAFQERMAATIENYTNTLRDDAAAALSQLIPASGAYPRYYVFNGLGFARNDIAEIAVPGTAPVHLVDPATGAEIRAEYVGTGDARVLRFYATSVPALGYKVVEVQPGNPVETSGFSYSGGVLRSSNYIIRLNARGAITSLVDRRRGNLELVGAGSGLGVNDFGSGEGVVSLERLGNVSATLRADIPGPIARTVRVTLYRDLKRIDIDDSIDQNFDALQTYSFNFNISNPVVRHEEVGAVIKARLETDGGQYSARAQNALYDWLTLNHFATITSGDAGAGVTLSNADAYFMRLGNSSKSALDTATPRIDVLAGGRAAGDAIDMIRNQGGDTRFRHRFSMLPVTGFVQADAMRFALGHQNPLITGPVLGGATAPLPVNRFYLITFGSTDQVVWAVKPAEEGIGNGIIVRVWNQSAAPTTFKATFGAPYRLGTVQRTTNIETNVTVANPLTVAGNQIVSYRLKPR